MKMTSRVMNPKALTSMYDDFPALNGSELTDVHVKRDEPRLSIKLITKEKPKISPHRWPKNYDVVYLELSFIGMSSLLFDRWGIENIVERFELEDVKEIASVRFLLKNQATLTFSCDWIRVESIAYGFIGSP